MSNVATISQSQSMSPATMEKVLLGGDLKTLSPSERLNYYNSLCESVGFNPLTRPYDYLDLQNKLVLYMNKGGAEQLRDIKNVSLKITAREKIGDVYVVTVSASLPGGRIDESTGAVPVAGLSGERLSNAYMKCETKAKRRATLSICGMNMLDETEVDSIEGARRVSHEEVAQMPASYVDHGDSQVDHESKPQKTLYPSRFPEYLSVENGQRRFVDDFSSDELVEADKSLTRWQTGDKKASFGPLQESALKQIRYLMTKTSIEREMDNELDAALARNS